MLVKVWEMIDSSVYTCSPTCVETTTLVAKSLEKIDKNVKCHFLSFSPTLNASYGLGNYQLICLAVLQYLYQN